MAAGRLDLSRSVYLQMGRRRLAGIRSGPRAARRAGRAGSSFSHRARERRPQIVVLTQTFTMLSAVPFTRAPVCTVDSSTLPRRRRLVFLARQAPLQRDQRFSAGVVCSRPVSHLARAVANVSNGCCRTSSLGKRVCPSSIVFSQTIPLRVR